MQCSLADPYNTCTIPKCLCNDTAPDSLVLMQSTVAATVLKYKAEYYGTITVRQSVIIAWSFQIAGKHNLWLTPIDGFVNPNKSAAILICQEKPGNRN